MISRDYTKTKQFYVDLLGFEVISEHPRPDKGDTIINVAQGNLVLELFIKPDAPARPALPYPEHSGLRHLAFKVNSVTDYLEQFDQLGIPHQGRRYDDFDGKAMAFFFDPDGLPLEIHE
ncbi:VOC family protein [Streptococcus moroccensis]|uniref:VOC family protein n=1 Tax=Streptococcus moroccensis TaxID=1451356 RepID=UPI003522A41E